MELCFALHKPAELDYTPHRHCLAMIILFVCNIKCRSTTLCSAGDEREVSGVRGHEEKIFCELAHERFNSYELNLLKRLSPKCYGVVGLRTGLSDGDGIILASVGTFD